jgi:nucleoside phosphorylase
MSDKRFSSSNVTTESLMKEPLCDFLVVIALKEEFRYFQKAFDVKFYPKTIEGRHCYLFRLPAPKGTYSEGIASFIGEMGAEEAAILTSQLLSATRAGLVVNLGISGIIDDQLRLGDVITATEADNYLFQSKISQKNRSKKLGFEDIKIAGRSLPTTASLSDTINNLEFVDPQAWEVWQDTAHKELTSVLSPSDFNYLRDQGLVADRPRLYQGPVATGPWVGAAKQFKRFLKAARNRNYLAMDMESAGVLQAIRRSPLGSLSIVLRGISDPADERKSKLDRVTDGGLRAWSMGNALRLFFLLISKVDVQAYSKRELASPPSPMDEMKDITRHSLIGIPVEGRGENTVMGITAVAEETKGALLSMEQIEEVLRKAVVCGLATSERRLLLLASIPPHFCYSLPQQANPSDQLRSDLLEMNTTLALIGSHELPLIVWLTNAARLVHPRAEANFFEEVTEVVRRNLSV